jgi:serine/threonine-protein kinase PRP4
MGSRNGSFDEEGEIFESDVEKAPPSLPSVSGPSVDRQNSRLPARASISPTHSSSSRHNDRYSDRDDYRRSNGDYPPRGEKRRRSREDDARNHRVHYEAGARDLPIRRPRVSYADIDRGDTREIFRDEPVDDRYYRESKRPRTRSRSPAGRGPRSDRGRRPGGRGYYDDRRRDGPDGYYDNRDGRSGRYETGRKISRDRADAERGEHPASFDRSRRDAETRSKDTGRNGERDGSSKVASNQRYLFSIDVFEIGPANVFP